MRKLLLSASLAGLMLMGAHTISIHSQSGRQSEAATKSVSGKIKSINGDSFAIEATERGAKHTMQFVANDSTQVKVEIRIGAPVTVQYQALENGDNLARSITAQG